MPPFRNHNRLISRVSPLAYALLYGSLGRGGMCPRNPKDERRHREKAMTFTLKRRYKTLARRRENPEIEALIRRRNELLLEHPQLRGLQEEIDAVLATTLDPLKRSEIIFMLISDKLNELMDVCRDLSTLTRQTFIQQ